MINLNKRFILFVAIVIVLLSLNNLNAQNKCFAIIDSITNEPIPYCNIALEKGDGFVTNHLGEFCIAFSKNDSLLKLNVTNVSYHQKSLSVFQNSTDSIIYLQPKQYKLNEIEINWSKYQFLWVGNTLKNADSYISLWRFCQTGIYIAPLKNRSAIIETISVAIQNSNPEKVPFRVHVFEVDSTGGVGSDLLPENVYGLLKDADFAIVELNILKYQLKIPDRGLFITVELLSNNKPNELQYGNSRYLEKNNNRIGITKARYQHRKLLKVSAWKPNSFYVEPYPFTNVPGMVGDLPMIKVKVRQIKE